MAHLQQHAAITKSKQARALGELAGQSARLDDVMVLQALRHITAGAQDVQRRTRGHRQGTGHFQAIALLGICQHQSQVLIGRNGLIALNAQQAR